MLKLSSICLKRNNFGLATQRGKSNDQSLLGFYFLTLQNNGTFFSNLLCSLTIFSKFTIFKQIYICMVQQISYCNNSLSKMEHGCNSNNVNNDTDKSSKEGQYFEVQAGTKPNVLNPQLKKSKLPASTYETCMYKEHVKYKKVKLNSRWDVPSILSNTHLPNVSDIDTSDVEIIFDSRMQHASQNQNWLPHFSTAQNISSSEINFTQCCNPLNSTLNELSSKKDNMQDTIQVNSQPVLFKVLSYNVLAQSLLESHRYLYNKHNPKALNWNYRSNLLLQEIIESKAEILCFQEVDVNHMESFYSKLNKIGYDGIFKRRTGFHVDGVAIYFKHDLFALVDHTTVEYYQPGNQLLNRDNVGLILKLAVKRQPSKLLIVATTHLLFNPKRHDIKLAQAQLLLTEVERFSFKGWRNEKPIYWPIIITGDMNFNPHTGVYQFITIGQFKYEGLSKMLTHSNGYGQPLAKELISRSLHVTDTCQHWALLTQRQSQQFLTHDEEQSLLKVYNSDHLPEKGQYSCGNVKQGHPTMNNMSTRWDVPRYPNTFCSIPIEQQMFGTGQLTHFLNLVSVYDHGLEDVKEVTTKHQEWVTVDYIFYSGRGTFQQQDSVVLVERSRLLTVTEAQTLGSIPNLKSPSDHYPLLATFKY